MAKKLVDKKHDAKLVADLSHLAHSYVCAHRPTTAHRKKYRILKDLKKKQNIVILKPEMVLWSWTELPQNPVPRTPPVYVFIARKLFFILKKCCGKYKKQWLQQIFREMFLKCFVVRSRKIKGSLRQLAPT